MPESELKPMQKAFDDGLRIKCSWCQTERDSGCKTCPECGSHNNQPPGQDDDGSGGVGMDTADPLDTEALTRRVTTLKLMVQDYQGEHERATTRLEKAQKDMKATADRLTWLVPELEKAQAMLDALPLELDAK